PSRTASGPGGRRPLPAPLPQQHQVRRGPPGRRGGGPPGAAGGDRRPGQALPPGVGLAGGGGQQEAAARPAGNPGAAGGEAGGGGEQPASPLCAPSDKRDPKINRGGQAGADGRGEAPRRTHARTANAGSWLPGCPVGRPLSYIAWPGGPGGSPTP